MRSDVANDYGSGGAGDADHVVVLSEPHARVASGFGELSEAYALFEGVLGVLPFGNLRELKDGYGNHAAMLPHIVSCF